MKGSEKVTDKEKEIRKLTKRVKQFKTIMKINNIIGFLNIELDDILKNIVSELCDLFPIRGCYIYLIDDNNKLCCWACSSSEIEINIDWSLHKSLDKENCITIRDGLPLIVSNLEEEVCSNRVLEPGVNSYICLPIVIKNDAIGVLTLDSRRKNIYENEDVEVLLSLATQVGLAIHRSRLYKSLAREKIELEEAQLKLIQSEKLTAIGKLAASIAHEINDPIGIISSRLDCLLLEAEDKNLAKDIIEDLEVIKKHTLRVARKTENLLSFSRSKKEEFFPVDINYVIKGTLSLIKKDFTSNGIKFKVNYIPDVPPIWAKFNKLQQVFLNILQNAREAILGEKENGEIEISVITVQDFVRVEITDNGPGIDSEVKNKIFDPFFSSKEKGTGLGLAITYEIIKEHNGEINVQNSRNKGATFIISLPVFRRRK